MTDRSLILVVDDEPQISRVLRRALESEDYEVRVATDGESGLDMFNALRPKLVITDLAMPNMDGFELCRKIRAVSSVPILVLSVRGDEKSKVEALDLGADDFITKPFGMDELLARLRALLRRAGDEVDPQLQSIDAGDFHVDTAIRKTTVKGREVHLTPKEYDLLLFFLAHRDKVVTHKSILTAIWGQNSANQNEYLRVFVGQLRKKIEDNPTNPQYLKTEPWIGYRFQVVREP